MLFWLKKFVSFWLMPLPFCLTLLAVGLCLLLWSRRARLGHGLLLAGTILLMLFSNKLVSHTLVRPLEARYPAIPEFVAGTPLPPELAACRFVVVLGSGNHNALGLSATNQLSVSGLARLTEAVRLLRVLPDARAIISGPGDLHRPDRPTHAAMVLRAAESLGLDRRRATLIENAIDTEEESLAVKRLVSTEPFALITSAWHLPRTMALFRHAGLTPLPCPADYSARAGDELEWKDFLWDTESLGRSTWAVRERIGYLWIWLRGRG
ncbi:MAG: envelope biogenesis factor ElyC [Opitutia bacterium]|nr:envelope biogenesis factor ElyC [Opitutaceae bacterium]PHX70272.1 MAG: envelope biogenesis factor ElyC [Opitutae bacterium]